MTQDPTAKSAPTLGSLCLVDRVEKARNFPHNTCAASRHAEMIGKEMLRKEGETTEAESILATVAALYEARTALAERRWVPVGERLPEDGKEVVVAWDDRGISMRHYAWRFRGEWRSICGKAVVGVTHWLPLPGLPS